MSTQVPAPTPEKGTESPAPPKEPKTYQQTDVDSITEKVRETERKTAAKIVAEKDAEIEKLRQNSLTEDQKKLEEAKNAGASEAKAELAKVKKEAAMKDALLEGGIDPKRMKLGLAAAKEFAPDAEGEALVAVLKKEAPELFQPNKQRFGPSGDLPILADDSALSGEDIDKLIEEKGNAWYAANRKKIQEAQARKLAPGTLRRLS